MYKIKYIVTFFALIIIILLNTTEKYLAFTINAPKQIKLSLNNNITGKWEMQTIVTNSNTPFVLVGSTTESNLEIKPILNLKSNNIFLKAYWEGGNWEKSIGTIKTLSKNEAITERVTKMKTKDNNNWRAILIDHLYIDNENENIMHLESIVTQFKNGVEIGEYKTYSILTKID